MKDTTEEEDAIPLVLAYIAGVTEIFLMFIQTRLLFLRVMKHICDHSSLERPFSLARIVSN